MVSSTTILSIMPMVSICVITVLLKWCIWMILRVATGSSLRFWCHLRQAHSIFIPMVRKCLSISQQTMPMLVPLERWITQSLTLILPIPVGNLCYLQVWTRQHRLRYQMPLRAVIPISSCATTMVSTMSKHLPRPPHSSLG